MSEPFEKEPQFDRQATPGAIADEMRELGHNLLGALHAAWESEERKRAQREIRDGLKDLGDTLNQAASDFSQSPTGQRMREDVEGIRQRVRAGELDNEVREEILKALRTFNAELNKAINKRAGKPPTDPEPGEPI